MRRRRAAWMGSTVSFAASFAAIALACAGVEDGPANERTAAIPVQMDTVSENPRESRVLLIDLQGTRAADVVEWQLPTLVDLGRRGARAETLVPVGPTNTFPNQISLATGVLPEEHGIVDDYFSDPSRGHFHGKEIEAHDWLESAPIWSIAERAGVQTAALSWIGTIGPWHGGPGPSIQRIGSITDHKSQIDQILRWLTSDDGEMRPRLILARLRGAEREGHADGPGEPSVSRALLLQDSEIERLVQVMEAGRLFETTTLLFVSDHGMAGASDHVKMRNVLAKNGVAAIPFGSGGFMTLVESPNQRIPGELDRIVDVMRASGLEAFRRDSAPADWHVGNPRFGDVVVRAPIGTDIRFCKSADTKFVFGSHGYHGYTPDAPEMAALLVAYGRGVEPGASLGRVSNLSVAPTVLKLLGLPVPPQMKAAPIPQLLRGIDEPLQTGDSAAPASSRNSNEPGSLRVEDRP